MWRYIDLWITHDTRTVLTYTDRVENIQVQCTALSDFILDAAKNLKRGLSHSLNLFAGVQNRREGGIVSWRQSLLSELGIEPSPVHYLLKVLL